MEAAAATVHLCCRVRVLSQRCAAVSTLVGALSDAVCSRDAHDAAAGALDARWGAAFAVLRARHDTLLAAAHGATAASVCPLLPLGDADAELAEVPHWQQ